MKILDILNTLRDLDQDYFWKEQMNSFGFTLNYSLYQLSSLFS